MREMKMKKSRKEFLVSFSLMLLIPLMHTFYEVLNNSSRGVRTLVTNLDEHIPLIKYFIIPYVSWYFFIFLAMAYFCLKDREIYFKTLAAYVLSLIVCYLTYYFYQTTVPRPSLVGDDLFTRTISFIYSSDKPYNAFPSIHVLGSYLMLKAICKSEIKNRLNVLIISTMSILIILSTILVKQHVILDLMAGILLAEVMFRLTYNYKWEKDWVTRKISDSLLSVKKKLEI
jgi:membrane-associated phospholipid phosphatase